VIIKTDNKTGKKKTKTNINNKGLSRVEEEEEE